MPTTELNKPADAQSRSMDGLAAKPLPDGVPCDHRGCLHHITHPCEGCGRIGGRSAEYEYQNDVQAANGGMTQTAIK